MKHLFALLCVCFFVLSCADDQANAPLIKIDGVYINSDKTNYSQHIESIPQLTIGDVISFSLTLDGNGYDLKTFLLKNENQDIDINLCCDEDKMSKDFSVPEEGQVIFVDDINHISIDIDATVVKFSEDMSVLAFYLFSKGKDSEGAVVKIPLEMVELAE
ncbi:DUF5035 domain-containing protein [Bacteroides sp. 214]|uniref:DUF5035 family protein n=1 Tax=Bacteroides sp. 214 TaxID=2302935 RepID=UPI0013D7FDB0|nr:DUF5035 family protein [Bacteroides sp. 214]NDW13389.1 DUF5035 domain-containing protein [Bacteroides sp. 214]